MENTQETPIKYVVYSVTVDDTIKYIGYTEHFRERKNCHLSCNSNIASQIADASTQTITISKMGEFYDREDALRYEQTLIERYDTINSGWNTYKSGHLSKDLNKYYRDYYSDNEERMREYNRNYMQEYRKKNRDKIREINKRYQQKKKGIKPLP